MDICRVCLAESPEKDINSLKTTKKQESKSCWEIFEFCLNIQVTEDTKTTTKLCSKCYHKIVAFYKFKLLAWKSDKYLKTVADVKKDLVKLELLKEIDLSNSNLNFENSVVDPKFELLNGGEVSDSNSNFENSAVEGAVIVNEIKEEPLIKDELENDSDDDILSNIKLKSENKDVIQFSHAKENNLQSLIEAIQTEEIKPNVQPKVKGKRGRKKLYNYINGKIKKKVCAECGKSVSDLRDHMKQHLPVEQRERIPCKACDKTFLTFGARYRHYRTKHLGIYKKCDICGKKISCIWSHRIRVHNQGMLKQECSICKSRFISKSLLDRHMLLHTKEKPFQCDICQKGFREKMSMLRHKREIHEREKSHLCQYCPKRYFKKQSLIVHMRTHTKERPYKCDQCSSSFSDSQGLKCHKLRTHVTEKKFSCELCTKTFAYKDYLRAHMVSHTKEKKYECKYCGIKFGRSDHRKRHQYTAHEKHVLPSAEDDNVPKSYNKRYYSKKDKDLG